MFVVRFQFEQVDNVNNTDLKFRHFITKDSNCSHDLKCRCITAAGHNNVWFFTTVIACPLPDTNTLCAVFNSLLHGQPLAAWMFGSYNCIDIVLTLDAVIEAGE